MHSSKLANISYYGTLKASGRLIWIDAFYYHFRYVCSKYAACNLKAVMLCDQLH